MKTVLFLIFVVFSFSIQAQEKQGKPPSDQMSQEKLRFEVISNLLGIENTSLKGRKGCESFVQSGQATVGKFVSWSLSFYAEGQSNSIKVKCEKTKQDETCSVMFYADSSGESPWSCGLRFHLDSSGKKIKVPTLECIGSC